MSYPWAGAQRPFSAAPPATWDPSANWGAPTRPTPNPFAGPPVPPGLPAHAGEPRVGVIVALGIAYLLILVFALGVSAALART